MLRRLDTRAHGTGATDCQLLDRFVHERDESAFELLHFRHGGMVLNVCRRILKRDQDAEDAFQANLPGGRHYCGLLRWPSTRPAWAGRW